MHSSSLMRNLIVLFRREWYWMLGAIGCVAGVLVINMRTNTATDYTVFSYDPHAVATLATIRHMQIQSGWIAQSLVPTDLLFTIPEQLQSAHGALLMLWMISRFLQSPFLILLVNYLAGAMVSVLATYVALRVATCTPGWAWLGSVAFGLMPARFWWPGLESQWFVVVPLLSACIAALWYHPQLLAWRQWAWYDWLVIAGVIFLATAFGKSTAYMGVLAIIVVVAMYRSETPNWHSTFPLIGIASVIWLVPTMLVWGMPQAQQVIPSDFRGITLSALVLPHASHHIATLATIGKHYNELLIDHNNTYYMGIVAVFGLVVLICRGVASLANAEANTSAQRVTAFVLIMLLVANQQSVGVVLVWLHILPFTQWEHASIWIVFWSLQSALHSAQQWMERWQRAKWGVIVALAMVVVVDQVPATTFWQQLPREIIEVKSPSWQQVLLLSQRTMPPDVEQITGFTKAITPYGRWAAPDTTTLVMRMRPPMQTPLILHIRAKTDPEHVGLSVPVQIGTERQSITLTVSIQEYTLAFMQPGVAQELVIHVPANASVDPSRGVVLVQSLWATAP